MLARSEKLVTDIPGSCTQQTFAQLVNGREPSGRNEAMGRIADTTPCLLGSARTYLRGVSRPRWRRHGLRDRLSLLSCTRLSHPPRGSEPADQPSTAFRRGRIRCSCGAIVARDCPGASEKYPRDRRRWLQAQLGWEIGNASQQEHRAQRQQAGGWAGGCPLKDDSAGGEEGRGPPMPGVG